MHIDGNWSRQSRYRALSWSEPVSLSMKGILMVILMCACAAGGMTAAEFASPEEIWHGYDPQALPLDIEVVESWQEDGCWYEKLRFTGEVADGVKTRVLTIRGGPIGGKDLAGVLHIHGGGQTVSLQWVQFWAKRGYACVSIDFCGKAYDRTEYTEWGPLETCNMPMAGDGVFVKPDLRASSWYHWIIACRRAITVLEGTQGVDPDRIGIFGISVGGTLCWMVAGCDDRVKAAAPIYGCGYNIDPRRSLDEAGPCDADHLYFKRILSPEANAPYMKCPVLFLSATNDMHGRIHTAYEILGAVDAPVWQVFTPNYDHHVEPEQSIGLPLWMDWQLRSGKPWPESPVVKVSIGTDGVPVAQVSADRTGEVEKVEVHYSLDDKVPGARLWRTVSAKKTREEWTAPAPVMDTWKSLHLFANVYYSSGVCLSSNLVVTIPGQLGKARATLRWTDRVDDADLLSRFYFVPAYTDPNQDCGYLRAGGDAESGLYFTLNPEAFSGEIGFYVGSHYPGDEQYRGRPGKALAFDFRGGFKSDLTVMIHERARLAGGRMFSATVPADAAKSGWQRVVLPLSAFKSEDGAVPETWEKIDKVDIRGTTSMTEPPCFKGFHWADAPEGQ